MSQTLKGPFEGRVINHQWRSEKGRNYYPFFERDEQVLTFQLEHYGEERLPPIPVEMRGQNFSGVLNEGHRVRLDVKEWSSGQLIRTKSVYNLDLQVPYGVARSSCSRVIKFTTIASTLFFLIAFLVGLISGRLGGIEMIILLVPLLLSAGVTYLLRRS